MLAYLDGLLLAGPADQDLHLHQDDPFTLIWETRIEHQLEVVHGGAGLPNLEEELETARVSEDDVEVFQSTPVQTPPGYQLLAPPSFSSQSAAVKSRPRSRAEGGRTWQYKDIALQNKLELVLWSVP